MKLSLINAEEFINFLKKFTSQEQSVLLELRCNKKLIIRTSTPKTKSIIKSGEIDFNEIFLVDEDENYPESILIGLYNINNFINTFSLLDETKIDLIIYFEQNKKLEYITKKTSIITDSLNYHFSNAPRDSFEYLDDTLIDKIFNTDLSAASFEIDNKFLTKINKLINNESSRTFSVTADSKKGIFFKGKQFELKVNSDKKVKEAVTINIGRQYLNVLDRDIYDIFMVEKGLIFKSKNSNTLIAIAREKDSSETMEHEKMETV